MSTAFARIVSGDGRTAGAGVHVINGQVLTASHVVNAALGRNTSSSESAIGEEVEVRFPLIDPDVGYPAEVVRWRKPSREDIATLKVVGSLPAEVDKPILAVDRTVLTGLRVRIPGFDGESENVILGQGEISGDLSRGTAQIDDSRVTGYPIQPGFSGSPAWLDGAQSPTLIGMLLKADPIRRTSIMASAAVLAKRVDAGAKHRGTDNWRFDFFRGEILTGFLNDLESLESDGLSPQTCPRVKAALGKITNEFSNFETPAQWVGEPLYKHIERVRELYDEWNNEGAGAAKRGEVLKAIREERYEFNDRVRGDGLIYQTQNLKSLAENSVSHLKNLCQSTPGNFADLRQRIRAFDKRSREDA